MSRVEHARECAKAYSDLHLCTCDALERANAEIKRLREAVIAAYRRHAPHDSTAKPVPPEDYAAMNNDEIDARWDFEDRYLAHFLADALSHTKEGK